MNQSKHFLETSRDCMQFIFDNETVLNSQQGDPQVESPTSDRAMSHYRRSVPVIFLPIQFSRKTGFFVKTKNDLPTHQAVNPGIHIAYHY